MASSTWITPITYHLHKTNLLLPLKPNNTFVFLLLLAKGGHNQQTKPNKMMNMHLQHLSLLLLIFLFITTTLAQSPASSPVSSPAPPASLPAPPASSPAPPGPTNVTAILEKAGNFNILIKLLKSTQVADQIYTQLNNSNQGLTIFAPPDDAFSRLKPGTLNSYTNERQVELLQFHMIPNYVPLSQFPAVSNPLRTQAGDSGKDHFPLNVTTSGNSVNMTTGIVNASVTGTIYTDGQLAVYQVDRVLIPLEFFRTPSPAPAPSVEPKKKKKKPLAPSSSSDVESSIAVRIPQYNWISFAVGVIAAIAAIAL
ncbi:hypothetical protein NE237_011008 [Protea cynaroides]|uniref:FAS1 domain-containing protein n=1 Tax=Protea cynaroides TaxID=273540 RepID=A0A9Q0L0E3_9MAGN|nr:hypothetical protein NE237_011008 [Protea cynaroides]